MEAPIFFKGLSRSGPTWRETVLMHAVARLALNPVLPNVQVSWVKLGVEGAKACLRAGANDLGGTLMNESISRSAGSEHGQELPPTMMDQIISSFDRDPEQRTTLYTPAPIGQRSASYHRGALTPIVQTPRAQICEYYALVWERLFEAVSDDPDMEYAMVDATIVKVHRHGQGAKGGLKARLSVARKAA